ncbi:MAG: glycosyltransferase, partial [bacterium]
MSDVPLIVHVVYAFKAGGLENGLVNIINRTPPERYRHAIVCLTEADEFRFRLERDDVEIIELHKKSGHDWGLFWRVFMTLRRLRPAIVHTRNLATIEMQLVASVFPRIKQVHGEHG